MLNNKFRLDNVKHNNQETTKLTNKYKRKKNN